MFFLLATLTGISRLYFRAHFVWDVIGGALIGIIVGILVTKKLIHHVQSKMGSWVTHASRSVVSLVGIIAAVFFFVYEASTRAHRVSDYGRSFPATVMVDFGTPESQPLLRRGWSVNEKWSDGEKSIV